MDARLLEKCKLRVKGDFVTDKDMTAAISERFEEVVQELIESAGMQYEVHPKLNGKEPDGAIYHDSWNHLRGSRLRPRVLTNSEKRRAK